MDHFNHVVSLGSVCSVPGLILKIGKRNAAYPFDNVGSPMWAVAELLANDFEDVFADAEKKLVFEENPLEFVVDNRYYLRAKMKKISSLPRFLEMMTRRINRLDELLSGATEPVLFIRSEECDEYQPGKTRIPVPEHDGKYALPESHWLQVCSDAIKTKYPELQFKILFLSSTAEDAEVDEEHNIVTIPCASCDYRCKTVGSDMKKLVDVHATFLAEHL